jgi:hypothetical protein
MRGEGRGNCRREENGSQKPKEAKEKRKTL